MKTYYKRFEALAFFLIIWIILNENFRVDTIIVGAFMAVGTLALTNKLLGIDFAEEFYEPPYALFKYFLKLVFEIYKASFDVIRRIFKGDIHPSFVEYESKFKEELPLVLLSNSITIVPGTAVIERCGSTLTILIADTDPALALKDTAALEKTLEKLERER